MKFSSPDEQWAVIEKKRDDYLRFHENRVDKQIKKDIAFAFSRTQEDQVRFVPMVTCPVWFHKKRHELIMSELNQKGRSMAYETSFTPAMIHGCTPQTCENKSKCCQHQIGNITIRLKKVAFSKEEEKPENF